MLLKVFTGSMNNQLFTPFVLYYRNDARELKHQSYCFISDDLTHNTAVVYCFQETLMNELKVTMNDITKIYYFSDGCAGQYKNCKIFSNITYNEIYIYIYIYI